MLQKPPLTGWFGAIVLLLGSAGQAFAQSTIWNGYQGSSQVSLNFVPSSLGGDPNLHYLGVSLSTGTASSSISLSQSNGNVWAVDTGSTSMVITSDYLYTAFGIKADQLPQNISGHITYSSSGLTYSGFYYSLNVGLYSSSSNGTGTLEATAQVPVLIATSLTDSSGNTTNFCTDGNKCTPTGASLEQFGIGFGRGQGAAGVSNLNPLLNLTAVSSGNLQSIAPGYVVSKNGVMLGLTSAQLSNTAFASLLPSPGTAPTSLTNPYAIAATATDWQTPAATITIKKAAAADNGTFYGSLLVDTGITNVELSTGSSVYWNPIANLQQPTSIQVYLPGATSSQGQPLSYTLVYQGTCTSGTSTCPYSVSSAPYNTNSPTISPIYPINSTNAPSDGFAFVAPTANTPVVYPFINTGTEFLNYFNLVYDPVSGFVGYQVSPTALQTSNDPALTQSIALQGTMAMPGGTTVSIPTFLFAEFVQGLSGATVPQTMVQLSSPGQVTMAGVISSAIICGSVSCAAAGLEIAGGTFVLTANNAYLGATAVDPGATLALTGTGSIASSSGVTANGTFDISGTAAGTLIGALNGTGLVSLGGQTLTINNAAGPFGGVLADGGVSGGVGGGLTIAGGSQTLTGTNTFTGATTISAGATLALTGTGSIAQSSGVRANGTFDISGTAAGASIGALNGTGLVSLGSQRLTVNNAAGSFGGVLTDGGLSGGAGGSLTIAGGSQTLTGTNAYTGATTINAGATLALAGTGSIAQSSRLMTNGTFDISGATTGASIGALTGTGLVSLGSQRLTVNNAAGTFGGVLADGGLSRGVGGSLTVAGGAQTLTGTNTYTGATTINAGATLALAGIGSIAQSASMTTNGTFDISGTNAGASIASLSGAGAVNLGSQSLTLTNASGIFSGTMGGSGGLFIGAGLQALTGNNTYTGATTVSGGAALAIGAAGALSAASGSLTLNGGELLALSSFSTGGSTSIGDAGGLLNANGFQLTLNGPMSVNGPLVTLGSVSVGGTTTVSSGQTSINGSFTAPSLVVASAGVLRGIGTINAPTQIMGRLAPGNSPGTLTFTAPEMLGSAATSEFDIDGTGIGTGAGNYSRIIVTGTGNSFIASGTLLPLLRGITGNATNSYTPPIGQGFNIVSAVGGVQGSYTSLTQPTGLASGTRFDALYGPTTLNLVVTPAYYGNLALAGLSETANQAAVGGALDAARPTAGVAMSATQSAIYTPLYVLPGTLIAPTLEQLSPTIYGDAMMVGRNNWYMVAGAINEQLEARRGALASDKAQVTPGPNGSTIWLTGLGQFGNVNSNGMAGYSSSAGGVATGIDIPITPQLRAGGAFGFSNQVTSAKNSASFNGDAFQFELYGSFRQGIGFLDAQAGGLFSEGTATRPLAAYGVQANGNTNGSAAGGSMRAGVRLDSGDWHIEPNLMLGGVALNQGSLTETLAGSSGLSVSSASLGSLQTLLGVRIERRIALTETITLVPSAQVGWLHEYLDTQAATQASFIGAPGAAFTVQSAPIGRDAAALGLRASLDMNGPISVYASYSGALNGSSDAQTVSAGLRYVW